MSDMYMDSEALKDLDQRQDVTVSKASQQRSCVVCSMPVIDHKAAILPIGGGIEALVHKACLSDLTEAMAPKEVRIPVVPVSKSTTRKATVTGTPFDVKRMADDAKAEVYMQLLKLGLSQ